MVDKQWDEVKYGHTFHVRTLDFSSSQHFSFIPEKERSWRCVMSFLANSKCKQNYPNVIICFQFEFLQNIEILIFSEKYAQYSPSERAPSMLRLSLKQKPTFMRQISRATALRGIIVDPNTSLAKLWNRK